MADLEKKDEKTRQWRSYSCSQLSAFCLQISLLLEAAVSLDEGFSIMAEDAEDENEKKMLHIEAIIQSMTQEERRKPSIIGASRKVRISKGSGTRVQDVNQLLKQFEQMQKMMKQLSGGRQAKMLKRLRKRK